MFVRKVYKKYHEKLLAIVQKKCKAHGIPLSKKTTEAFEALPRHLFVHQFRSWKDGYWHKLNSENLSEHLEELYEDQPLRIYKKKLFHATISQPTIVFEMLELLEIKAGMNIFELGTGSGWNAALMAYLTGNKGKITTSELIPSLCFQAIDTYKKLNINNIDVILNDGTKAYQKNAPYDRIIFTAADNELSKVFFDQTKSQAIIIFVYKTNIHLDLLIVLCKTNNYFYSKHSFLCRFVSSLHLNSKQNPGLNKIKWPAKRPLHQGTLNLSAYERINFLFFLSISEKNFKTLTPLNRDMKHTHTLTYEDSITFINEDYYETYENLKSIKTLLDALKRWREINKPQIINYSLEVHPENSKLEVLNNQWLIKKNKSQFLWKLESQETAIRY